MNLANRIAALETAAALADPVLPDVSDELTRWNGVLNELLDLDGIDDPAADVVVNQLQDRFGLFTMFAGRDRAEEEKVHPDTLLAFVRLLPDDLRSAALVGGLSGDRTAAGPWLDSWLLSLARHESRIPEDLDPNVLSAVVQMYLDRPDEIGGATTCPTCRLRVPTRRYPNLDTYIIHPATNRWEERPPDLFTSCPNCSKG